MLDSPLKIIDFEVDGTPVLYQCQSDATDTSLTRAVRSLGANRLLAGSVSSSEIQAHGQRQPMLAASLIERFLGASGSHFRSFFVDFTGHPVPRVSKVEEMERPVSRRAGTFDLSHIEEVMQPGEN